MIFIYIINNLSMHVRCWKNLKVFLTTRMSSMCLDMEALLSLSPSFNMVYRLSAISRKGFLTESFHYSWGVARKRTLYKKEGIQIYLDLSR